MTRRPFLIYGALLLSVGCGADQTDSREPTAASAESSVGIASTSSSTAVPSTSPVTVTATVTVTVTTSRIPVTTTAPPRTPARAVTQADERVPQAVLDLLADDEWLYGFAVIDATRVIIGTATGLDLGTSYRCSAVLYRADIATRARVRIGEGIRPTLSPDGTKVAFAHRRSAAAAKQGECGLDEIAVFDVPSESVHVPVPETDEQRTAAFALRWSPDGTKLRYYRGIERSDAVSPPIVLDVGRATAVTALLADEAAAQLTARYRPAEASPQWWLAVGQWLPDGTLAVRPTCGLGCLADRPRSEQPGWYRLPSNGVLRTIADPMSDATLVERLDKCLGLSYC